MLAHILSRKPYSSSEISNVFQEISGNSDLASLFWIGSAVEFAYHKDVDWLFSGKGILQDCILRIVERIMALLSPVSLKPFHQFKTGRFFPLALKLYRRVRGKFTITLLETILIPKRYRRQAHAINVWT